MGLALSVAFQVLVFVLVLSAMATATPSPWNSSGSGHDGVTTGAADTQEAFDHQRSSEVMYKYFPVVLVAVVAVVGACVHGSATAGARHPG